MTIAPDTGDRTPARFPHAYLIAEDFDGTVAATFERSPAGIGVNEIQEIAIEALFGVEQGPAMCDLFRRQGGLRNRAPREVVQDLMPSAPPEEVAVLTKEFIGHKLAALMGEIGNRFPDGVMWPRPIAGYMAFRERLANEVIEPVDEIIISSGHQPFIAKTYAAWGLAAPLAIVATEVLDDYPDIDPADLIKPAPGLMRIARGLWRTAYGLPLDDVAAAAELTRITYVGDDIAKDGGLAANSGVSFVHIDAASPENGWRQVAARIGLGVTTLRGALL